MNTVQKPNKEILLSCFQALSDDYVTNDYKGYLTLAKEVGTDYNQHLELLEKVDMYYEHKNKDIEEHLKLGVDILETVLNMKNVKFCKDDLQYMEEVALSFITEELHKSNDMFSYERGQSVLAKIEALGLDLNCSTPLTNVGFVSLFNKLESDVLNKKVSRDSALDRLDDLSVACVYAGSPEYEIKLVELRGVINTTKL